MSILCDLWKFIRQYSLDLHKSQNARSCVCLCVLWILVDSHGHVGLVSYEFLCAFGISSCDVCNAINANQSGSLVFSVLLPPMYLCLCGSVQDMSPFFITKQQLKDYASFLAVQHFNSRRKSGGSKKTLANIVNVIIMGNRRTASHNE